MSVIFISCHSDNKSGDKLTSKELLRNKIDTVDAPVLTPSEALQHFVLQDNFKLQLIASEPMITTPVAIKFDNYGRIWAVEMNDYMPDTSGNGEEEPIGKIVILEDKNNDGVMDTRKVFMDSLVMPRAICLFNDGILVAEPPNLWFVENNHDKAGRKYLVDSQYTVGGNVEHQPNGLLRGLDNWIYNAKSANRYRRIGKNKWIKEHTHFRGQWGITQDEYGRLYYNTNSDNLIGDYFAPGLGADNPHQRKVKGYNENIVSDTRVYPVHPTPGVNRGYKENVLDDSLRLVDFTAACGPVIFKSDAYGKEFYDNAFVAEPAGNLVKRDILSFNPDSTTGKEAYEGKEFLASTDERFRPVYLSVGPDGALYVVDMYRGIIQHKTYLTHYLASEIMNRALVQPLNCGRIYRVIPNGTTLTTPRFSENDDSLLTFLNSSNSWLRETAHNYIIDKQLTELNVPLHKMLESDGNIIGKINVMWVLEGLNELHNNDLKAIWADAPVYLKQQILTAAIAIVHNKQDALFWLNKYKEDIDKNNPALAPYFAYLVGATIKYSALPANDLLVKIAREYQTNPFVVDAIISNLNNQEKPFLKLYSQSVKDTTDMFIKQLNKVIKNAEEQKDADIANKNKDKNFLAGKQLFTINCQVCHGDDGNGIKGLGAPLNGSNWVQGDKSKLLAIVLYGLTGPIKVGEKLYAPPEVAADMPAMNNNNQLKDKDIAQIATYIRKAWNNRADNVTQDDVKIIRQKYHNREQAFTMKELLQLP
ncbi:MAG: c-type cytochrome [Bacteroidota bacterium]|nr:c-type cytochrome [Bacteroidota bacterium]